MEIAVGWNPAVGYRVTQWFRGARGQQIVRVARALFHQFGLELDEPAGAWFFEILPDGSVSSTVSEVKWKIWSAIAVCLLDCPVPDAAVHLLIASDYFTRREGRQREIGHHRYDHLCALRLHCCKPQCHYIVAKLDKKMAEGWVDKSDEEVIANLNKVVEGIPSPQHAQSRLSDAMRLFDLSASLADLVLAWFLIRLGNDEEKSLDWLVYSEKQAMVDRHAGGRGQFENLLFFFFQNVKIFDPPSPERIAKICAWFYVLPKVEFRGIDITSAVRQILVHFIGARVLRLSFGDHECLKHFIEDHSQIFHNFGLYLRSNIYNCHNVSALIGRLLFTWTRTSKGQRDHDELKELCKFTGNSFVEHVKSTLGSSNSCEDERQLLFHAAARVFGEDFSGQFVTLCANSQWEDNAKLLQTSELGEIMELAKQGQFQVANPLPKKVVTSSWLGEIILYLANLVLEDSMPYTFDRTTWIQDCRGLLIDPVINRQHMTLLLTSSRRKEGVYLAETVTKKICQELGAWIHSPKTVKKLEASLEDIDNALRDVMLRAAGGEFSDKHETLLAKMAKLLGFGKMDGMYGLARAYVLHGMPGKGGGDGHPNSKKSSSMVRWLYFNPLKRREMTKKRCLEFQQRKRCCIATN